MSCRGCWLATAVPPAAEEVPSAASVAHHRPLDLPMAEEEGRYLPYRKVHTVEVSYCKRPIQCLASSKILTPHRPASVCTPPPLVRGEDTLAGWGVGWGVNILEDARHCSVLYICKYFVVHTNSFRSEN